MPWLPIVATMLEFARTATIGPLRLGLAGDALDSALREVGLVHDASAGSTYIDGSESLEVSIADGSLDLLGLDNLGDFTFRLPPSLGDQESARLTMVEMLDLLSSHGCRWTDDEQLTFADQQSAIRTAAGVSVLFAYPETLGVTTIENELTLHSMYASPPKRGGSPGL
jgi:hypothetical protein